MLSLINNNFMRPSRVGGFHGLALHRDLGFSNLFEEAATRQRAFTNDLPDQDVEMAQADGAYSSSYSFSSSTVTGPDGQSRKFSQERYVDSHGRTKNKVHRHLGDRSWVRGFPWEDEEQGAQASRRS